MSQPMQLVEYACGHATPVRGAGGKTARVCPACEGGYRKATGLKLSVSRLLGHEHPGPYCSCEQCQTTIP